MSRCKAVATENVTITASSTFVPVSPLRTVLLCMTLWKVGMHPLADAADRPQRRKREHAIQHVIGPGGARCEALGVSHQA